MKTAKIAPFLLPEVDDNSFSDAALQLFHYQAQHNPVYSKFINLLGVKLEEIDHLDHLPFLPVDLFKSHQVLCSGKTVEKTFFSSSTTGSIPSKHQVASLETYQQSLTNGFERFYGSTTNYTLLALLPSYVERKDSSLVYMVKYLIKRSGQKEIGFYLNNLSELASKLAELDRRGQPVLLIGVSFALLDLAQKHPMPLSNTIIMETGGMKGRRRELTRQELHHHLKEAFSLTQIHSEYGMTELLSQAYAKKDGIFYPPPWMKVFTRDISDPQSPVGFGQTGVLNIIDLANADSCAFVATGDLGKVYPDGSFEVLGRMDNSELRGCNLMVGF